MSAYKIVVETGVRKGASIPIPPAGISIGRATRNDVHIPDEELSRHHCRLYFLGDDLWVSDLATLNGTSVNDTPIEEPVRLKPGDHLLLGESRLRIEASDPAPAGGASTPPDQQPKPEAKPTPDETPPAAPDIDLGFSGNGAEAGTRTALSSRKTLVFAGIAFLVICLIAIAVRLASTESSEPASPMTVLREPAERTLVMRYEKVEGTESNVFRYALGLDADGILSVQIDDLNQGRHVIKKTDTPIDPGQMRELIRKFERAGFYDMDSRFEGIPRANTWNTRALTAVIDGQARTVHVRNRVEPDAFKTLREEIETFGRNELSLWNIEFSREKLIALARERHLVGRKRFEERQIRLDNLHTAIQDFKSAVAYLETIEPKPAFYNEIVGALEEAERLLEELHSERNWQADHAINTRNWEKAATVLRELMEIIPDRADPRNRETEKRLLDVESRIQKARK